MFPARIDIFYILKDNNKFFTKWSNCICGKVWSSIHSKIFAQEKCNKSDEVLILCTCYTKYSRILMPIKVCYNNFKKIS